MSLKLTFKLGIGHFLVFVGVSFTFFGCLDQIDLVTNIHGEESVVIDAKLRFGDTTRVDVQVQRLFNFQPGQVEPLALAKVQLIDDQGRSLDLERTGIGVFSKEFALIDNIYPITLGSYYQVLINTTDGRMYTSAPDQLIDTPPKDNFEAKLIELPFLSLSGRYEERPFISFKIEVPIQTEVDGNLSRFRFHFNHVLRLTDNQVKFVISFKILMFRVLNYSTLTSLIVQKGLKLT